MHQRLMVESLLPFFMVLPPILFISTKDEKEDRRQHPKKLKLPDAGDG